MASSGADGAEIGCAYWGVGGGEEGAAFLAEGVELFLGRGGGEAGERSFLTEYAG